MTLSVAQQNLLDGWLPGAEIRRDHSWGLVGTTVLELIVSGQRFIVKAGDDRDHHIGRELDAHERWLTPLGDRAPRLVHADRAAKILVTRFVPGTLVLGHPAADRPETFRQAGALLKVLHHQIQEPDPDFERRANAKTVQWLEGPHRIDARTEQRLRAEVASWPTPPATLVPTHGDWHPRNWLIDGDTVRVIDFGRAAMRPAYTDFTRLAVQDFRRDPALAEAFIAAYGADPRTGGAWRRNLLREGIATAAWAFRVGDEPFEAQGHRMIGEHLG